MPGHCETCRAVAALGQPSHAAPEQTYGTSEPNHDDANQGQPTQSEPMDKCEFCLGQKGVPGNENIVGGIVMCDYCHSLFLRARDATQVVPPHEHAYEFSSHCGAWVCNDCGDHRGLTRCYCGWSRSGGDGRRELEDMGETIDPEDY